MGHIGHLFSVNKLRIQYVREEFGKQTPSSTTLEDLHVAGSTPQDTDTGGAEAAELGEVQKCDENGQRDTRLCLTVAGTDAQGNRTVKGGDATVVKANTRTHARKHFRLPYPD